MISARCRCKIRGALGHFTEGNFAANARNLLPGAIVKPEGHRDQEVSPTRRNRDRSVYLRIQRITQCITEQIKR